MTQYVDKAALIAEIEKLIERANAERFLHPKTILAAKNYLLIEDYNKLLSFIDTLKVKEVDLEKELNEWMKYGPHTNYPWCTIPDAIKITAEHFFEFGLKAQKGGAE